MNQIVVIKESRMKPDDIAKVAHLRAEGYSASKTAKTLHKKYESIKKVYVQLATQDKLMSKDTAAECAINGDWEPMFKAAVRAIAAKIFDEHDHATAKWMVDRYKAKKLDKDEPDKSTGVGEVFGQPQND